MTDVFDLSLFGNESLPLVLSPRQPIAREAFFEQLRSERASLKQRLLEHGALLFRGFPLQNADDFAGAIDALGTGAGIDYIGGDSPRTKIKGAVYTSTEAPADLKIPLHNELSFVQRYPKYIHFFCEIAPSERGETILGDARRIYRALDPEVRVRFIDKRLKYVSAYYGDSWLMDLLNRVQPSHKPWRDVFETTDRAEVERLCREHAFEFAWHRSNWIRISQTRPAAIQHDVTGEWVWFSQAHLYDFNPRLLGTWRYVGAKLFYARPHTRLHEIFHADGSAVKRRDLYHL
ncbi:MAG TPA: TauD/TfdA family dioxygenase, partial [Polyangiales bacterium]|nr:TauD/TfdA family dioxygenase [Polyangiales bacterium]